MRGGEPLVEAGGVELMFTSFARQSGKGVVGSVNDGIANGAFLHPLKFTVNVLLPHLDSLQQCSILISKKRCHGENPFTEKGLADPETPRAVHLYSPQRVAGWEPYHNVQARLFLFIHSRDFTKRAIGTNGQSLICYN